MSCFVSNIHDLYHFLYIIGYTNTLTYSGWYSNSFGTKTNTDSGYLHPDISDLGGVQRVICACCGKPGHEVEYWIIIGQKLFSPSLLIKKNQYNTVHLDKPHETPNSWTKTPHEIHFKSPIFTPRTSTYNIHSPIL